MKHYNVLAFFNVKTQEGEVIKSRRIDKSFRDEDLFDDTSVTGLALVSYVSENNSIQEAEREAIAYMEELFHDRPLDTNSYVSDRSNFDTEFLPID